MKYIAAIIMIGFATTCAADFFGYKLPPADEAKLREFTDACKVFQQRSKENAQCGSNCLFEKLGFLIDGVPQESAIKEKLSPVIGEDAILNIMKQCNFLRGVDNCKTALILNFCYFEKVAHLGSMPKEGKLVE